MKKHVFSNRALAALLLPLVIEQFLNSMMGTADTIMVSNVGSAAISAASLVDSLNILVIQVFSALAAGELLSVPNILAVIMKKKPTGQRLSCCLSWVSSPQSLWRCA